MILIKWDKGFVMKMLEKEKAPKTHILGASETGRGWSPSGTLHSAKRGSIPRHSTIYNGCSISKRCSMNKLQFHKQTAVLSSLLEGCSIRSTERLTGVHRDTIMRLLVKAGEGCERLLNDRMQDLPCRLLQVDEIWTFVQKKQRHVLPTDDPTRTGDIWTFVALDPETKLVPTYRVGGRNAKVATDFIADLSSRLKNRVQLSSDALPQYVSAIERVFGANVDYGQIVKSYEANVIGPGRYSPPHVVAAHRTIMAGQPNVRDISTSLIERQNLTMRMSMRRFTRLTNAFSKKIENLRAAVALHFAHYNFVRIHRTLRVTPAMATGLTTSLWTIEDLLEQISN